MIPQRAPQFDLPPGTRLGKYELVRKLAMGGMAEIYLARVRGNAGFEKLVVIKRILPTVADDPKFVQMFMDEARLAATLQHPNIASVFEVGEHDGAPFFTMEFVHGQDVRSIKLAARARKEHVPLAIALAIIHGTAQALDHAHDRTGPDGKNLALVHRDVSTSNILVSYDGAIKLIDFGIARAASTTHKTKTGTLKGKIPYMSPEQCRGGAIDRRSDLFSLGVVMYELTTGRRPFRGETDFAIMDQIVHRGAERPSASMRGYPPELEAIVMRLLAREAADRYQTAEQMLHDLDPFLAQHRLWVSSKPLGRYMRFMFADHVDAWDKAVEGGVTLAQHLSTVTSPSGTSQVMTPPSAFPAVLPLSQEMPAVAAPTGDFELESPTEAFADPVEDAPLPAASASLPTSIADAPMPSIKKSRAGLFVGALVLIGLGGGATYFALAKTGDTTTASAAPEPKASAASKAPEPKPAAASPRDPKAAGVPAAGAPDSKAEPNAGAGPKPGDSPSPGDSKTAADTKVEESKPAADTKAGAVETKPDTRHVVATKKPVVVPKRQGPAPKKIDTPPKDVTQKDPPKDTPKDPPKDKDPNWTIDSPFLPSAH